MGILSKAALAVRDGVDTCRHAPHGRSQKRHWLECFTAGGRYTIPEKTKEQQRRGRQKYSVDSFDMVLDRRDPMPSIEVPTMCKVESRKRP